MQIASNNDGVTWDFLGPDGTASSYYTSPSSNIHSSHNDDEFLRYKLYLSTASSTLTPNVSDISFTFSSECVPPGQVVFTGLSNGSYTLNISAAGYQSQSIPVSVSGSWRQEEVLLLPN